MGTSAYYRHTVRVRCNFIIDILGGKEFFKGKTLLDLGANQGDFANFFSKLGADVTCHDIKPKNLAIVKAKYPQFKQVECDLNKTFPEGQWDIVLHMRILQHLADPAQAIRNMAAKNSYFIVESRVLDTNDPDLFIDQEYETKDYDMHSNTKRQVGAAYYESVFDECGLSWKRHDDPRLNSGRRRYDWKVKETKEFHAFKSRFWWVWRDS